MNKYAANTIYMFFSLLRAGLWNKEEEISPALENAEMMEGKEDRVIDWQSVYKLAVEQTVAGYVAAGVDKFIAVSARKKEEPGKSIDTNESLSALALHDSNSDSVPEKVINVFT